MSKIKGRDTVHQRLRAAGRLADTWLRLGGRGLTAVALALLWIYQATVSPFLGPSCRFVPSCSEYARQSLRRHGVVRGSWMAIRRLLHCHPFHPGGWDPVT